MPKKIFTKSYSKKILKEISNQAVFSAEEHAYAEKKQDGHHYQTKEKMLKKYLPRAQKTIANSQFLIDLILEKNHKNIISFGAGAGVKEYLLKRILPKNCTVISTDFDPFIVGKVKEYFPEIIVEQFDFRNQNLEKFSKKIDIKFDLAIFFDSSYVLDDENFVRVFKDLKKNGLKNIVDFNGAYISLTERLKFFLIPEIIRQNNFLRKIFQKKIFSSYSNQGKFHGYSRTRRELHDLYKKAGWKIIKDNFKALDNKYIASLS